MGAAVRVEAHAFSDERYVTLARIAELADEDHARGKMLRLWRQCTDRGVHVLSADLVVSVLGPKGCDALLRSELGELAEGGIRICGTAGRIEWLENLRKNGKKGGKAKAKRQLSKGVAKQEKEKEVEPVVDSFSLSASDLLRDELVWEAPTSRIAKLDWATCRERTAWARELETMHRIDQRDWPDVEDMIRWVFRGQVGDARFVVQSPASLRSKWDRISAVRARPQSVSRGATNSHPTAVALSELHRLEREAHARGES